MSQPEPAFPFEDDPFARPATGNDAGRVPAEAAEGATNPPAPATPAAVPAAPAAAAAPAARPDWLVGAEEGVNDELKRSAAEGKDEGPGPLKIVKLDKPKPAEGGSAPLAPGSFAPRIGDAPKLSKPAGDTAANPAAANAPPAAETRVAWTAAASSIPVLRRAPQIVPAHPPAAEEYEAAEDRDPMGDLPDDLTGVATHSDRPLAPLQESWWMIVVDELRSNRRTQILVLAGLVLVAAFLFWPRSDAAVSLSTLHRHPDLYDGRTVFVHGRVLDVFPMGGGHTFYLLQGRDTIVVFTRQSAPSLNQNVSVKGVVSTGYLDGIARQSIFEDQH
jgi:hypothetical protein